MHDMLYKDQPLKHASNDLRSSKASVKSTKINNSVQKSQNSEQRSKVSLITAAVMQNKAQAQTSSRMKQRPTIS